MVVFDSQIAVQLNTNNAFRAVHVRDDNIVIA